jgi:hypothetical protein
VPDREVEAVAVELLHARVGHDAHVDAGTAAGEAGEPRDKPQRGERGRSGDRKPFLSRLRAQPVGGGAHGGQDLRRRGIERLPRLRERERPVAALEQLHPELLLQLLDLAAHRRLGEEQFLARLGEGQVARGGLESDQQVQRR